MAIHTGTLRLLDLVGNPSNAANYQFDLPTAQRLTHGAAATAKAGATSSDLAEFNRLNTLGAKPLGMRRSYSGTDVGVPASFGATPAAADKTAGRTAFLSFKSDLARMANGQDDAALDGFLATVPAGTVLTWQHEPDAKTYDKALYRQAGARFGQRVKAARPDIVRAWVITGWTFSGAGSSTSLDWWWGDNAVDLIAPDPYNSSAKKYLGMDSATEVGALQGWQFARAHSKRFGVAEWGCYDLPATNRPRFITDGIAWMRSLAGPTCEFQLWFHSNVGLGGSNGGLWLDTTPASLAAWKTATSA